MTRFIVVDVEATGGVSPFSGVMTEFGAVDVETMSSFHGVLYDSVPSEENPAIPVIVGGGYDQAEVFIRFEEWLKSFNDDRLVFVSDNNGYDAMWMAYYCDKNLGYNPFGHSSRRIGDLYAGLRGKWRETSKWKRLRQTVHDHNPVNDALGNAEALRQILAMHNQTAPWD